MEIVKTLSIADFFIVIIGLIALIIQWRAYKQDELEFKTKLKEMEDLVHRLDDERKARESEIEARITEDAKQMNYTSEMWERSYKARTGSHIVLRNDIVSLALMVKYLVKEIENIIGEKIEKPNVIETLHKACLGIVMRGGVYTEWVSEVDKLSEQRALGFSKLSKRILSPVQLHNEYANLNEIYEVGLDKASERHKQDLQEIEKLYGRSLDELSKIHKDLL